MPAPGGGIQRIGYDQAQFEQAVREVILEPKSKPKPEEEAENKEEEVKEEEVKVELKAEDIAMIVSPMLREREGLSKLTVALATGQGVGGFHRRSSSRVETSRR
jgi:hypothetical protein